MMQTVFISSPSPAANAVKGSRAYVALVSAAKLALILNLLLLAVLLTASTATATEYHVSIDGSDSNPGTQAAPFRTIQHAANLAQPGDAITVQSGVYRERVNPPRGGNSDTNRIVYQAAPGANVTITGSEPVKGWQKVGGDTWKVVIPNKYFGSFNPYSDLIRGDWYHSGRPNHTGAIYLNGDWLTEAATLDPVLAPASANPLWYAKVDGAGSGDYLVNIATLKPDAGAPVPAAQFSAKQGGQPAPCTEGGQCVGFIQAGDWLRYDNVDFGPESRNVELRVASLNQTSEIDLHLDSADGELIGSASAGPTRDWQKWTTIRAAIKPTSGRHTLCLVVQTPRTGGDDTTIWAQFKGVDPNTADVEMNVRKTVFTPEKTGINYITLRGFTLRDAATNWAPPSAGQIGIVTAYWCKGWIIEDNDIAYSRCCGIALGKYSDAYDNTNAAGGANPYTECVHRALANGWDKATVGSHLVRNNRISHCEQTGIVGSMGCSFSTVEGNEIHDIHVQGLFGGAEMAGIKFHGAIDVTIRNNNIYHCGPVAGIWLDWMGQGAQVIGNLLHDNTQDLFAEMQHGPILLANNLFLSPGSITLNSQGIALVHNLILGRINILRGDDRSTPYHAAHSTAIAGMYNAAKGDSGDLRLFNNIFVAPSSGRAFDNPALPSFAAGNVYLRRSEPSNFDATALVKTDDDPGVTLTQKKDGWYLTIAEDNAWRDEVPRKIVTTDLLGIAKVPSVPFENADGSPIRIATDYLGRNRDAGNPFPGPFETVAGSSQTIKVWPLY